MAGASAWCDYLSRRTHPVLTWYSEGRIELSGPVLARWLAKADNFLAQEFPFGAGMVHVALPLSWQRLVWDAALLMRGWPVVGRSDAELVVGNDAALLTDAAASGQIAVAQTLSPLALSWPGPLPVGVLDGTAELMGQADYVMEPYPAPPLQLEVTPAGAGDRALLKTPDPERLLGQALALWEAGASALIVEGADDEAVQRILTQERVTLVID